MYVSRVALLVAACLVSAANCALAEKWHLEASPDTKSATTKTLTIREQDHYVPVDLRVSCSAEGFVTAGLRLGKRIEPEDIVQNEKGRFAIVGIRFPKDPDQIRILLRATLGDTVLLFDDSPTPDTALQDGVSGMETWSVERLVKGLATNAKVRFWISIQGAQDFEENFSIGGFREVAVPLAEQCPTLRGWIAR